MKPFTVDVPYAIARNFVARWHYSGCMPRGRNLCFGHGIPGHGYYAMAVFGNGAGMSQESHLAEITGRNVTRDNMVELKRLCRTEPRNEALPLTRFISHACKILKATGVKYVVAYSDPEHGHSGGIYKAASFQHMGLTKAEVHYRDEHGEFVHRRIPYLHKNRHGYGNGHVAMRAAVEELKLTPYKSLPKDRWFRAL